MRVLIIEDNPVDLAMLQAMLRRAHGIAFDLYTAATLTAGLDLLRKECPEIVLLDLGLPDIHGLAAIQKIIDIAPAMPVVVMTAEDDEEMALDALREGAQDYLVKGKVNIDVVVRALRYAVERSWFEKEFQSVSQRRGELERIVNQSPAVAFIWRNDDSWSVEYVSDNIAQFGYTPQEIVEGNLKFLELIYAEDRNRIQLEICHYKEEGRDAFEQEYRVMTKEGELRWVNDWTWVRRNDKGEITGFEGVVLDVTEHRRLEIAVMEVSSREQQRIGQDLHDSLGQYLTGLAFQCKALQQKLSLARRPEAEDVAALATLINESINRAHGLAQGLNPVGLDAEGLLIACEGMAANISCMFNVECTCVCAQPALFQHCKGATQLYWIAHEAVNNAVKYSQAEKIKIQLGADDTDKWLKVTDDGIGFKIDQQASNCMGLHIMRSRAKMLGGILDISTSSEGTSVRCIYHFDDLNETKKQ